MGPAVCAAEHKNEKMLIMLQRNTLFRLAGLPLAAALVVVLGGCAVVARPLDAAQRERLASEAQRRMFEGQEPIERPLSLAEATAPAVKYQSEPRQRSMKTPAPASPTNVT